MDLRIFTEPQEGASYDDLLRVAQATEELGFDGFFRSDHFTAFFGGDGLPGPTDAWVTLAALARETSRIRLGTLVTAATFRLPGPLAIAVAQVDAMSGGRIELGLGTGWHEGEHTAYGIPFPSVGERFERFEEQLQVITGLWGSDGAFSFDGKHYRLAGAPALPKPVQERLPVIVGGGGKRRTPRIAATYADEFNLPFQSVDATREQFGRVREACEQTGRSLVLSAAQTVLVGRDDAEVARRAAALGGYGEHVREHGLSGTPGEVVEKIGRFADAGVTRLYLQVLDLSDLDHLEVVAREVAPQL